MQEANADMDLGLPWGMLNTRASNVIIRPFALVACHIERPSPVAWGSHSLGIGSAFEHLAGIR